MLLQQSQLLPFRLRRVAGFDRDVEERHAVESGPALGALAANRTTRDDGVVRRRPLLADRNQAIPHGVDFRPVRV
jgi:hypothetical protein